MSGLSSVRPKKCWGRSSVGPKWYWFGEGAVVQAPQVVLGRSSVGPNWCWFGEGASHRCLYAYKQPRQKPEHDLNIAQSITQIYRPELFEMYPEFIEPYPN